jgi:hypothetical protein
LIRRGISSVGGSLILKITSGFGFSKNLRIKEPLLVLGFSKILRIKEPLLVLGFLKILRIKEPLLVLGF